LSVPLIIALGIALALLALAGLLVRAVRSRRGLAAPVTEAQARAHALPLTKSVLSVGPSAPDRLPGDQ
jgi:heme exporter protein D